MRRNYRLAFCFTVMFACVFLTTQVSAKTYNWIFASIGSENSFRHQTIKKFKEVVEKDTNGKVNIKVHLNGVLGSAKETFQSLQMGGIHFQMAAASAVGVAVPEAQVLSLPFIVDDREEAYAVLEGPIGDKICALLEKEGVKVLGFADLDFVQITNSVRPINTVDDFKGLIFRAPPALQYIATFKALGSSVSTMPLGEVYMALNQNLIHGQFNPLDTIRTKSFHEVQDYLAITNIFFFNTYFCMNKDAWDSLDPELQKIVQNAAIEGTKAGREFSKNQYEKNLELLKPHFKEITYPDIENFREKVKPVYEELEKVMGKEIISETTEFLKKYRDNKK